MNPPSNHVFVSGQDLASGLDEEDFSKTYLSKREIR